MLLLMPMTLDVTVRIRRMSKVGVVIHCARGRERERNGKTKEKQKVNADHSWIKQERCIVRKKPVESKVKSEIYRLWMGRRERVRRIFSTANGPNNVCCFACWLDCYVMTM